MLLLAVLIMILLVMLKCYDIGVNDGKDEAYTEILKMIESRIHDGMDSEEDDGQKDDLK